MKNILIKIAGLILALFNNENLYCSKCCECGGCAIRTQRKKNKDTNSDETKTDDEGSKSKKLEPSEVQSKDKKKIIENKDENNLGKEKKDKKNEKEIGKNIGEKEKNGDKEKINEIIIELEKKGNEEEIEIKDSEIKYTVYALNKDGKAEKKEGEHNFLLSKINEIFTNNNILIKFKGKYYTKSITDTFLKEYSENKEENKEVELYDYSNCKKISLGVKPMTGIGGAEEGMILNAPFNAPVILLKEMYEEKKGDNMPIDNMRIIHGGTALDDNKSIDKYNINNTTTHVTIFTKPGASKKIKITFI